ncbi:MAG: peptidoglycan DD-metalloendopeptidase family protein, partial [Thermoflexales bacterium]|nr:peptidoglycan DD-metalloendopeptidase family protein [Thermoflexales bacterium]
YDDGTRTYDGHRGTDYALYPFGWNKLEAGEVQVIAAAAGTIINKVNVDPTDHNCIVSSNDPWNYVTVLHADGRLTIYGHLRYNSLTSKSIGQAVAQGEYLGTAASSGNSSGPHLHFEVRTGGFTSNEWVDPYAGPNSQPASLWTNQRPYYDSAINKLATHAAPPGTPDACQPSIPNLQDSFTTPRTIYFYSYYRDFQGALPTQLKIYRPDGSTFQSWQYTSATAFSPLWSAAWVFNFPVGAPSGTWRFEAVYNGQTYETFFNVDAPTTVTVTSPNGGEQWNRHQPHSITWTDNLGGEVNIALYHNGVYSASLATNTPSDGEYLWTPGLAVSIGTGYTISVTSVISPTVFDVSDAPFTLNDGVVIAHDDGALTLVNTPTTIDPLSNDEAPNHQALTITAVSLPLTGTVGLVNSRIIYTPTLDFLGTDVFTYTASASTTQASATVTVIVAAEVFEVFLPLVMR